MNKSLELSLDHPMLAAAKIEFEGALKRMVSKAVSTRSMEGTATLKISMDIMEVENNETKEWEKRPVIKFKAGWSVPIKENTEGKMPMNSQLVVNPAGEWCLISNQISMDELMDLDEDDTEDG